MAKKITQEQEDLIIERLTNRIDEANTAFLIDIGKYIKKIGKLNYNKANQLVQMLKYGGNYEQILAEVSKYADKNINEIDEIFEEYGEQDQKFYEQFYRYKDQAFIPFKENEVLQRQKNALASMVKNELYNYTRSNVLGYTIRDEEGNPQFLGLRDTYNRVLEEALLNVSQGKESFDTAMSKIMKDLGGSGLKTIEYENGRSIRLDSAVRMHLSSRLKELHNESDKIYGETFGADGVEISVHSNPADDHAEAQGRQFYNDQFELLQTTGTAEDVTGKVIDMHRVTKKGVSLTHRPISEMNCRHYTFSIVVGVSEPEYSDEELEEIQESNRIGFDFEGEHYTNYEGTQLQRKLEIEIRKQKDIQILAKAGDNKELLYEAQGKINQLTKKYKELSEVSGLPTKIDRMKLAGYRRVFLPRTVSKVSEGFVDYRNWIDKNNIDKIDYEFNFKGFITEYDKFYNNIDKKEIENVIDDYHDWLSSDRTKSHPIGQYLNKLTGYDKLPELISKKDFWTKKDGTPIAEGDYLHLDKNHWFRGLGNVNDDSIETIKGYIKEFKYGEFYAGKGHNGNGTYVSKNYKYVTNNYGNIEKDGILYVMPKSNAKIISIDKIYALERELELYIDSDKGDLYYEFASNILKDNGYLAELLGYDIIDLGDHKLILNRGSIKVVK